MITVRRSSERGERNFDWLKGRHTFSFADYHDPAHLGFLSLRVINQDIIAPGRGFATHAHEEAELITYVIRGVLVHQDSMGNKYNLPAGEVQCTSAGSGIKHSEYNHSMTEPVELLQIWILPEKPNLTPRYANKTYDRSKEGLQLLVSHNGEADSLSIYQDAKMLRGLMPASQTLEYPVVAKRGYWLQIISGELEVENNKLLPGDGAALSHVDGSINITGTPGAEFLLFDLC